MDLILLVIAAAASLLGFQTGRRGRDRRAVLIAIVLILFLLVISASRSPERLSTRPRTGNSRAFPPYGLA